MTNDVFAVRSINGTEIESFSVKSRAIEFARNHFFKTGVHTEVVHLGTAMVVYRTSKHNWSSY